MTTSWSQKSFDRGNGKTLRVLEDINLGIRRDEFLCMIGPSGCGKSTLMRIAAGLIEPTKGQIFLHGQPHEGLLDSLAIVFQAFALYPWLTLEQNVQVVLPRGWRAMTSRNAPRTPSRWWDWKASRRPIRGSCPAA
jgi:NitT/TauT family transport system ATP-binding protein